jgi:hypothetical protein
VTASSAVRAGRAAAARLMVDTCTVTRPGAATLIEFSESADQVLDTALKKAHLKIGIALQELCEILLRNVKHMRILERSNCRRSRIVIDQGHLTKKLAGS